MVPVARLAVQGIECADRDPFGVVQPSRVVEDASDLPTNGRQQLRSVGGERRVLPPVCRKPRQIVITGLGGELGGSEVRNGLSPPDQTVVHTSRRIGHEHLDAPHHRGKSRAAPA